MGIIGVYHGYDVKNTERGFGSHWLGQIGAEMV
jgi:hypothetical protein